MLNVALTGNVAAGKSSILRHFAAWGATVIDADALVREAQTPGSPVLEAIRTRFGREMLRPDGTLDRARLRRRVMRDEFARRELNAIVHPAVEERRQAATSAARDAGDLIVVNDIPLLFEVLDPRRFDAVVLVEAAPPLRRERLMRTRGLPAIDADELIGAQMKSEAKRESSDFVIENTGSLEDLAIASQGVWAALRGRAARHAAGRDGGVILTVAEDLDAFLRGPVGTAARYLDAGLDVHLLLGGGAAGQRCRGMQEILHLADAEVGPVTPEGVAATQTRLGADITILTRPLAGLETAWTWVGGAEPAGAELDVRPWRDLVDTARRHAGITAGAPASRERFRSGPIPDRGPLRDLFGLG